MFRLDITRQCAAGFFRVLCETRLKTWRTTSTIVRRTARYRQGWSFERKNPPDAALARVDLIGAEAPYAHPVHAKRAHHAPTELAQKIQTMLRLR